MANRARLDTVLVEQGLFVSREQAQRAVMAGSVKLGDRVLNKSSLLIERDARLSITTPPKFVGRGGLKLEGGLEYFRIDPAGATALDIGASTGGFTDCLLQRGAGRVIALDVGRGQLDWSLRNDPRVEVLEGLNARELVPERLPYEADLAVIDVSFISLAKVLGPVADGVAADGSLLAMVKPQFELGRGRVGKGGVVRSAEERAEAVAAVVAAAEGLGLHPQGVAPAGLPGPKGNREVFVLLARRPGLEDVAGTIARAVR